ncbi:MAG: hypothetical protein KGL64_09155 [Acidobacteriota bacterium]|nr:hypothetical protein [Acidobacteriota bacterium]
METSKIRMKIGDHEFEAEGPIESVQEQLAAFKELVGLIPTEPSGSSANVTRYQQQEPDIDVVATSSGNPNLERIMRVSGRVVSLTAIPQSIEDAALLIMLGHQLQRNNESVTGQEIGDGLAQSGRGVDRVDRIMVKPLRDGLALKSGVKRSTRYRLTNQGYQKAMSIAKDLIASLP